MSHTSSADERGVQLSLLGPTNRRARIRRRRVAVITSFMAILAVVTVVLTPVSPAEAVDYPTWGDLQSAKSNTAAAAAKVTEIQNLIDGLQTRVAEAQAESEARGYEMEAAQAKFDDAALRADNLQAEADSSQASADAATRQAGQLAAQLYRTGGTDLSVNLFLDGQAAGDGAEQLLSKLGSMTKLVERSSEVYDLAQASKNNAQSLGDQAKSAQAEREKLRIAAESALAAAQAAADAAAEALAQSEAKSIELDQQLKFMQDTESTTASAYEAGVAERARQAAEAARAAAAAAAAAEAAGNSNSNSGGGSSSAGPGLGGGYISSSGWAVPSGGRITDGFGPRQVICSSSGVCSGGTHYGADLGAGCGSGIYAAAAGTVEYAGRYGTYGNFVLIDNGNGVSTGYAHIRDGGIFVSVGQSVSAGQNIASVGMTGAADGCHLHFEVRINGNRINPIPFMAERGAALG